MFDDDRRRAGSTVDWAAHAASLGCDGERVDDDRRARGRVRARARRRSHDRDRDRDGARPRGRRAARSGRSACRGVRAARGRRRARSACSRGQAAASGSAGDRRRRPDCASASSARAASADARRAARSAASPARRWPRCTTPLPRARAAGRATPAAFRGGERRRAVRPPTTSTRSRSARSTDTHVDADRRRAAAAGKADRSARSRSRSTSPRSTGRSPRSSRAGVLFQVGFNRRFDPAHRSVRDAVASGAIGDVAPRAHHEPRPGAAAARRTRGVSGGLFLDMTIHDFDMARYVTGSEVVEVYARGAVRITPELGRARRRRHRGRDARPRERRVDA